MSTPPPADPKDAAKNELTNTIIWAALAAVFAVFMYVQADKVDPQKRNFYLVAAGLGGAVAAVNGYSAYTQSQKAKQPPAR